MGEEGLTVGDEDVSTPRSDHIAIEKSSDGPPEC